ncbi:DUF4132 domain-containing protein [Rapidithrix thailandica]|uniref:DUF4132 domain-containing protein n=1 Tax=Rapidithrix thailandica TaxID=413964 RepID=A0AAW9S6D1_9BACT
MIKFVRQLFQENKLDPAVRDTCELMESLHKEIAGLNRYFYWDLKLTDTVKYEEIKKSGASVKKDLLFSLLDFMKVFSHKGKSPLEIHSSDKEAALVYETNLVKIADSLFKSLIRQKLEFTSQELISLFIYLKEAPVNIRHVYSFSAMPVGFAMVQLEKHVKKNGLDEELKTFLEQMLQWKEFDANHRYWGSDLQKAKGKLEGVLFSVDNPDYKPQPYQLSEGDAFGKYVNEQVAALKEEERDVFYGVFRHALTATAGKPSQKWLKEAKELVKDLKKDRYKRVMQQILGSAVELKVEEVVETNEYQGRTYQYTHHAYFADKNALVLKGLIWTMVAYHDRKSLLLLARLTEHAFRKIPGIGPAAAGVGNACIYVLANSKGVEGISHLSRLKLSIRQNNTQNLIQKYIDEASEKLGISAIELEELSVPDFDLVDGKKTVAFDDYHLEVAITGIGKTQLTWYKPDGNPQKSVPVFVKSTQKHKDRLKRLKDEVKQIQKYTTAQRDRIDRLFVRDHVWSYEKFKEYYLEHGLVKGIAQKLIWTLVEGEQKTEAFWYNGQWENVKGEPVETGQDTQVILWHPIHSETDTVLAWRERLAVLEVRQPMKQAYREVYLLTEAEINTRTYSNRMAAHLLKQHQFNALTSLRGWKYSLMGAYDDGRDNTIASFSLPEHGIEAEYWINEIHADDAFNDAGIWLYVATDQVRFINRESGEVLQMVDIPKIVLSEVMRDVDLFVGVCSVGNDPAWRDNGGMPQYRDYWTSYSFGDLTEVAQTRKKVLEKLIPRLKIKKVAEVDGRFLKVKGKVRDYKIHIGSTNILMEPNDQYLCIVPDRKSTTKSENVFLPFEGDRGLSVVLSKAFLLAEDDKITDPTILSQLKR